MEFNKLFKGNLNMKYILFLSLFLIGCEVEQPTPPSIIDVSSNSNVTQVKLYYWQNVYYFPDEDSHSNVTNRNTIENTIKQRFPKFKVLKIERQKTNSIGGTDFWITISLDG